MPIIVKGIFTNLSEKPKVVVDKKTKPKPRPTVTITKDNDYLNKIESAKNSHFHKTIEGEKPNWTKSDYLVDMLSE